MRELFSAVAVVVLATSASAVSAGEPTLLQVPAPPVAGMEEAVRHQLEDTLETLRSLGDEEGVPAGELAEAFGETGRLLLAYDLVDSAEACFRNAHALDPEDFRWPYLLGAVLGNDRRVEEALPALRTALDLRPEDLAARMRLGDVHLAGNDPVAAGEAYGEVLRRFPETAAAHAGLGRAAAAVGEFEAAVEHYRKALALAPEASALRYPLAIALRELGRREEAREQLALRGEVEVRFPDPLTRDLLALTTGASIQLMFGHRALKNGQVDLAVRRFRQAIEANPQSAEAQQALGAALAQQGDGEGASRHYSAALALRPDNPTLHYNLGTLLLERGETEQAIRHFQAAIVLLPAYDNARFNLATALAQVERHSEALEHFQELLTREPEDRATRFFAANSYHRLGRQTEAAALLDALIEQDAKAVRARLLRSRVAVAVEDLATARRHLTAVLAHPEVAQEQRTAAHRQLGDLEARAGRYERAAQAYVQAVAAEPRNANTRFALAMAWLLAERYEEAADHLAKSTRILPQDMELSHLRARFLATCPVDPLRDGSEALEISSRLLRVGFRADIAETVAMAYAELGRFEDAVRWQQRLLREAERAGLRQFQAHLEEGLKLYGEGLPMRAPWLVGSKP